MTKQAHPKGLYLLFVTEMWERFSYYGMRALLMVFMLTPAAAGGLGFSAHKGGLVYGTYTLCVYVLSILGGFIADNFLGARRTVLIAGIIIAAGHYTLALHSEATFMAGLVLVALGSGLLKPNMSSMVGALYEPGDPRRDSGFSIFYMGVNLGALTTTSDLKNNYGNVRVWVDGRELDSGSPKVGSLVGAHVKTGIGSRLPTGASVGTGANLFAGGRFAPKRTPSFAWWDGETTVDHEIGRFLATARIAFGRRGRVFSPADEAACRELFDSTAGERRPIDQE